MSSKDNTNEKVVTLRQFVEERKDLITVASVFVALTLFAEQFVLGLFGELISLLFLGGFLLLWAELWGSFPNTDTTRKLAFFEEVIVYSGFALIAYWYLRLKTFSPDMFVFAIALPISAAITIFISKRIRSSRIFERLKIKYGSFARYLSGTVITFAVLIPVMLIVQMALNAVLTKYGAGFDAAVQDIFTTKSLEPLEQREK